LDAASEVPPHSVHGRGSAKAELDTETRQFRYVVQYDGLTGAVTAAHFHGPADPGRNAPPAVMIASQAGPLTGSATLTDAQIADLRAGKWYVNLHTAMFPAGEIRGQILEEKSLAAGASSPTESPPAAAPAVAMASPMSAPADHAGAAPENLAPSPGSDRSQIEAMVAANRCDQAFDKATRVFGAKEAEGVKARCQNPKTASTAVH
jgi:hypothetical protein